MHPAVPWLIGIGMVMWILYQGIPRVMQPDPTHAFGVYLSAMIVVVLTSALARMITGMYLLGYMDLHHSWLARKIGLSYEWFESVMVARERQTEWLADLMCSYNLPKGLIGYAFKAGTNICVGSPALLLARILEERGHHVFRYDPVVEKAEKDLSQMPPHVFLIGTNHPQFAKLQLPAGSVVIDPWRLVSANQDVQIVHVGAAR